MRWLSLDTACLGCKLDNGLGMNVWGSMWLYLHRDPPGLPPHVWLNLFKTMKAIGVRTNSANTTPQTAHTKETAKKEKKRNT